MELNKKILENAIIESTGDTLYTEDYQGCGGYSYDEVDMDELVENIIKNYKILNRDNCVDDICSDHHSDRVL